MSVDMNSQGSDSNEEDYDPNCEEEEEDEDPGDIEDYYDGVANDVEQQGADAFDPEEYQFTCLTYKESESTLNEHMASLAATLKVRKVSALTQVQDKSVVEQANAENTDVTKTVATLLLRGVGGALLKVPCWKLNQRFTIVTYRGLKNLPY